MTGPFVGGSFAPPLTDEQLGKYESLGRELAENSPERDAYEACLKCCKEWWFLPESDTPATPHPLLGSDYPFNRLDQATSDALWDHIPWEHEIEAFKTLFANLQGEVRDAAHHLLWHAAELCLNREPMTNDRVAT
jgi:hypothetical protein